MDNLWWWRWLFLEQYGASVVGQRIEQLADERCELESKTLVGL